MHIRQGLQRQAVPKDEPPAVKARARKELSKDDKIAELEFALSQRDAKEAKMAQQLSYFKQVRAPPRPPPSIMPRCFA